MRLSMWQQFSANHSSSLVIIGRFASPDKAKEAAQQITNLLIQVKDWFLQHEHEYNKIGAQTGTMPLTEPEIAFSAAHSADIGENSLLYWGFWPKALNDQQVRSVDHYVVMTPYQQANMDDPRPVAGLITALGGEEVYLQLDSGAPIWDVEITLSCDAPNIEIAEEVMQSTNHFFEKGQGYPSPSTPWGWGTERGGYFVRGKIRQEGSQLVFDFVSSDPYLSLVALREYLMAQGFTTITYLMCQVDVWQASE